MGSKLWLIAPAVLALAVAAALKSQVNPAPAGYKSPARYLTEEDAIRRGEQIGIGEATLEGPREAPVNTDVQLKLTFRVGRAGMKTGGGIRIASAHGMGTEWGGLSLQTTDPNAENYLAFHPSTNRLSSGLAMEDMQRIRCSIGITHGKTSMSLSSLGHS